MKLLSKHEKFHEFHFYFKVVRRAQVWKKKHLFENSEKFDYSFTKNSIFYMYLSFIFKIIIKVHYDAFTGYPK